MTRFLQNNLLVPPNVPVITLCEANNAPAGIASKHFEKHIPDTVLRKRKGSATNEAGTSVTSRAVNTGLTTCGGFIKLNGPRVIRPIQERR